MARKTGLGRGLDALIPGGEQPPSNGVNEIPVDRIIPNPRQPRQSFHPGELQELAASIREHGVIQPLIVSHGDNPGEYVLIAGERRLLAARQAGLATVPAILRDAGDQQRLELALIENVQRSDLSPLEAAEAYRQLAEDFHLSHKEIAERVGKSREAITNTLGLLKLSPAVQQALLDHQISEGHARALGGLPTAQAQSAALQTVIEKGLNVRQTEELVRRLKGQRAPVRQKAERAPEVAALESRLRSALGTRVNLSPRRKGGTITIHYYSDEELDAIISRITGEEY
ncbi:MAG: ParB/RepB/Spo0J family partition protein [Chloroflexi bacterium]|nr:ParB/RepB/Spo0J family partition protein [Chloroflexota bacterium]